MKKNPLKISIITVCYNSVRTIEQTIQSVIHQSYNNIEYIIIDGGSTDGTLDIIRKYESKIAYWISEPDQGIYDAMNKGIQVATGDVIGIINSDDWYMPDIFPKIVNCFQQNDISVLYGNIWAYYEKYNLYRKFTSPGSLDNLRCYMMIHHPSVFVRRIMYEMYGRFECRYQVTADYDFLLRLYEHRVRFFYLQEDIAVFRMGGISNISGWRTMIDQRNVALEHAKQYPYRKCMSLISKIETYTNQVRTTRREAFWQRRLQRSSIRTVILDTIEKKVFHQREIVIFGAGDDGIGAYIFLQTLYDQLDIPFWGFIDNDKNKWNHKIDGYVIGPVLQEKVFQKKVFILIASAGYREAMEQQLKKMNLLHNSDWLNFSEMIDQLQQVCKKNKFL